MAELGFVQRSPFRIVTPSQLVILTSLWLFQELVTFEDVSLHFTEEEWALLSHGEKALYWDVMHQNYDNVTWLGKKTTPFPKNLE